MFNEQCVETQTESLYDLLKKHYPAGASQYFPDLIQLPQPETFVGVTAFPFRTLFVDQEDRHRESKGPSLQIYGAHPATHDIPVFVDPGECGAEKVFRP